MDRTKGYFDPEAETRSWSETLEHFEREVCALVDHAYRYAPAMRSRMDAAGIKPLDIRTLDDLAQLPVIPKMALVELQQKDPPFGGLLAAPLTEVQRIFHSPGPIYDPQGRGEGWGWEEGLYACGFRPGDVCINTFAYHMTPAGMMFDDGLNRLGCAVIPTGVGEREAQVGILKSLGVTGYAGMATFLLQIGEKAKEMGLDPRVDFKLKAAFSTAEPMPDSLRNAVEEMFGLTLRQGYGTADCGCLAYECYHRGGMHLTTHAYVEIVDPQTGRPMPMGEVGEVVVTLFNRVYPLIRFGTGDLSAIDVGDCACGRSIPKLRGWLGRADQLAKVKGQFIHPGQVQKLMGEFPEWKKYRFVVTRTDNRDRLTLKVETGTIPAADAKAALEKRIRDVLRIGGEVEWTAEGSLPADGKLIEDARTWE
jgi:phenylacetate-CoA ligase